MKPASAILTRLLTVALAVLPPLAGLDLCTVGAFTGRADLMCGMERGATACDVPPACPHCAADGPAPVPASAPAPHGPTCCDVRPPAAATGEAPALVAPAALAHPAAAAPAPLLLPAAAPAFALVEHDDDRAPPGAFPPPRSPRAPPLA